MQTLILLISCLLLFLHSASAAVLLPSGGGEVDTLERSSEADTSNINPARLAIVAGLSAGGFVVGHIILNNLWWKGEQSPFHFTWRDDWVYALGADKLGHFYTPYVGTDIYRQAFEWGGMSQRGSLHWGAALASGYTTYIEVRDGFSEEWGFSLWDFIANNLGVGWRVAEYYEPWLQNIRWKVSFDPSDAYKSGAYSAIIDDYESTYHWGSLNVNEMLPQEWQRWWPDWINIAVGHSVKGVRAYDGSGNHELYLSLDWNTEGLPGDGSFWNWLKRIANYYHLPAPAVRIAPNVVWYGLKL
ncbi:MAG: DUF2279 domain-containing protein [Candidatus Kapaibacterium sp.]